jgi:exopolysaccharide production protein ExoZ
MFRSLQACRAAAALLVVLFHLGGTFAQDKYFGFKAADRVFAWGDAGVDFFFVLSGFLITTVHWGDFGRPGTLRSYLFKRTLRIYPSYWLVCGAVCLAALFVPALRQALPSDALVFAKALALIPQDPALVGGTGSPILFVAWSLQYEMLFYAVIAVFIAHRLAGWLVVAALALLTLPCRLGGACGFPASFVADNMVFLFAMGVAAACAVRSRIQLPRPLAVAVVAGVAFVGFGALEVWLGREALPLDRRLVFGAIASVLIVALARAEATGGLVLRQRWPDRLGDASYALYLLHIPIISVLCKLAVALHISNRLALVGVFIGIALVCVLASVLFYELVERRVLAWGRAASKRPPQAAGRAPSGSFGR